MDKWNTKDKPHCYLKDGKVYLAITVPHPVMISVEGAEFKEYGKFYTEELLGLWEEFEFQWKTRAKASPTITGFRKRHNPVRVLTTDAG